VKGYYHTDTDEIFFREKVVVESPDFTLRTDTLKFFADVKTVVFVAPTLILQDTAKIYTEGGFYNIPNKKGSFNKNPQYLKGDQKAWARRMEYDGFKEEITLIGNAHFEDSTTNATADRIVYNERTGVTILQGNAHIVDDERNITGDTVTYDSKKGTYATRGRSHIVDGAQILDADQVDYDKEREVGIAKGNVILQDTTEKITLVAAFAEHSKSKNYFKASGGKYGRPLLIRQIDGDSIFISADTLLSFEPVDTLTADKKDSISATSNDSISVKNEVPAVSQKADKQPIRPPSKQQEPAIPQKLFEIPSEDKIPEKDSLQTQPTPLPDSLKTDSKAAAPNLKSLVIPEGNLNPKSEDNRIILAYHDVRIFKSDLQALCDSLSYSSVDSMFRLFDQPIIWSDTSQFTADTVNIQLANDKIDHIFLRQNSFIINSPDEFFFNQIKGKHSLALFDSSELRRVRVEGNAESVYYALDDNKAYIGVNKTVCSEMLILFGNNEVEGIKFYTQPKATLFPMAKADHEGLKMPGFSWQIERRPTGVEDLLKAKTVAVPVPTPTGQPKVEEKPVEGELPKGKD
jgi:lipopolysaccharide export system protein LptA